MLKQSEKKFLTEIADYFFRTTGTSFDDYVTMASTLLTDPEAAQKPGATYALWLLKHCMTMLSEKGISPQVCIENKDVFRAIALGEISREEGEFYTPEIWCQFGRKYLQELLPEVWGTANVWDIACGTGNLMRTSGYPADKLFMSTLLEEDAETVRNAYPEGTTVFQLDACNGIDYDSANMLFSNQLPDNLREKLETNQPLIFYINPPYKVGYGGKTDVAQHMAQAGYGHSAADIYHHFLYRICMLVDTYHLTNTHIGVFGPTGWLLTQKGKPFRDFIFDHFKFKGGMAFKSSEFANVGEGNDWTISMSVWSTRQAGDTEYPPIVFDYCERDSDGEIHVVSKQLTKPTEVRLQDWCKAKDVERYVMMPQQTAQWNFGTTLKKEATNAIMSMMTDNTVIDGVRRAAVMTFPSGSTIPVTTENYWRCVASFGARSVTDDQDAFLGRQVFSAPDTGIAGFEDFVANCFALWLFANNSYSMSYRDVEICGSKWTHNNNVFPLGIDDCRAIISDPTLLADLEANPSQNEFTLGAVQWAVPRMCAEAKELFEWSIRKLISSLQGTVRKDIEYKNGTFAYDASLVQIRAVPELWSEEDEKTYRVLNSRLRAKLKPQVAKFGFIHSKEDLEC